MASRLAATGVIALGILCVLPCPAAHAQRRYTVTDLGSLPGGTDSSRATDVNDYGQVVGDSGDGTGRAFLWTPSQRNGTTGSIRDLGDYRPGVRPTYAAGINNLGQVTGSNGSEAWLWTPSSPNAASGTMVGLGFSSIGVGINDSGQTAGQWFNPSGRAFLWTPTTPNGSAGSMTDLGTLPDRTGESYAVRANRGGQVVGWSGLGVGSRAILWSPSAPNGTTGSMTDLGVLPGGTRSVAWGVNTSGQVVGFSRDDASGITKAFLWSPSTPNGAVGTMLDLGDLPGSIENAVALDVSDGGLVVGSSWSDQGPSAFLWNQGEGMLDLNRLLDATGAGWQLTEARGINAAGQIVGEGLYDPDGIGGTGALRHAVLLTPVPEPAGAALVTAAGTLLALRRRR